MILWDWVIEKTIDLVRVQFWSFPAYQIEVSPRKVAPVGNSRETRVRSLFLGFNNACGMLWHILDSCLQIVRSMPEGGFDLSFACNISCHDATLLVFKTPHYASLRITTHILDHGPKPYCTFPVRIPREVPPYERQPEEALRLYMQEQWKYVKQQASRVQLTHQVGSTLITFYHQFIWH